MYRSVRTLQKQVLRLGKNKETTEWRCMIGRTDKHCLADLQTADDAVHNLTQLATTLKPANELQRSIILHVYR
jgi:hypothetical protein